MLSLPALVCWYDFGDPKEGGFVGTVKTAESNELTGANSFQCCAVLWKPMGGDGSELS